ncbi:MAG TPA: class I SAM-dependent methyltransferase, partial [Acidimicrobiia bacterium]
KSWRREDYSLEVGGGAEGVKRDPSSDVVQHAGDEWGAPGPLRQNYQLLLDRFLPGKGTLHVLEIGAGGGRSTVVFLDILGGRAGDYHVVDVSAAFVEVLKERVTRPIDVHIVGDIDLSSLPKAHFDVCLAQSSWSHISIYDQYRYLRELRSALKPGGVIFVSGQFLLGIGNDWTWNRFANRVRKLDEDKHDEIFHEFTSIAALAEMLLRLGYDIGCINASGFIARRGSDEGEMPAASLLEPISFPFNPSTSNFLETGRFTMVELPFVGTGGDIRVATVNSEPPTTGTALRMPRLRKLVAAIPGARPFVRRVRAMRRPRSSEGKGESRSAGL